MSATIARTDLDRPRFFINNEWVDAVGADTYTHFEAATGDVLGSAAMGSAADIDAAVRAARAALDGEWGRSTAHERAVAMRRFADALAARGDATATLVTREIGMPIALSHGYNNAAPPALLRTYADMAETVEFEEIRPSGAGATIVRREPVGVVAAIVPWNYPQGLAMMKVAPALAAGCTVVIKPSPETALDAYVIGEAAKEAGLPPGVLNIVAADRDASAALVNHPGVDKISFTGSTIAGRNIASEGGRLLRRLTLELGGKSAAVLLDDVDLDTFLDPTRLSESLFQNNGQTCTAQSRILAPRSRYDEIVDALASFANAHEVGDPLDPSVAIGPLASERHLRRVNDYIEIARNSPARLVAGGGRPKGLDRGWFVEPTVFADVDNRDRIAQEEIFGPVLAVIPYTDDQEAIKIANDSSYGLGGAVWTQDEQRGIEMARQIRTGTIGVNYYQFDIGSPFGGMKASGLGREGGPEGLEQFFEYKSIYTSGAVLEDR